MKSAIMQHLIYSGDMEAAEEAAYKMNPKAFRSVKSEQKVNLNYQEVEMQSLEAAGEVKKGSDHRDKFHIYRVNSEAMTNKPDYVMKSSSKILEIAVAMDQDGPPNILQEADAFFDGIHSRCRAFVSQGLWVFHPFMRRLLRLVSTEVRSVKTADIGLFWEQFNKMLAKITKKDN